MQNWKNCRRGIAAVLATSLSVGVAHAAGTDVGVEAGFHALHTDLSTILNGAGGFLIMILSVIIAGGALALGLGARLAIYAFAAALVLGYGTTTLSSFAGVSADVNMVTLEQPLVDQMIND